MQGFRVPRRWGWDCHGLPIENLVEKELKLKSKKDIESFGLDKFNEAARASVLRYADEWKKTIPQIGRWVDMENDYKTMDANYTESVWWMFKTLYEKSLIYEGHKSMHMCPRCETTLANFEVAQGYKDVKDISVTVKFELADETNTFLLAWTTTPWTLPGNVALAINPEVIYCKVKTKNEKGKTTLVRPADGFRTTKNSKPEYYILAKVRKDEVLKDVEYEIMEEFKGSELIGKKYKPLFDYYAKDDNLENRENGWKIYGAEFVTTEEGTGAVHIAPAFGEDDMNLGRDKDLPFIQHVGMDGRFRDEVKDFAGISVKPKSDDERERLAADIAVIQYLQEKSNFFVKEKITHSYPHCWRCDTPLLNYASSSWFIKVTDIKEKLLKNNKKINWVPSHLRDGRFGKWLEGARDWAISRTRFWGAPIPVWRCEKCSEIKVAGSVDDIKNSEQKSGNKYFVIRHGEAKSNATNVINGNIANNHFPLTEKGIKQAEESGEKLKDKKIDLIIASDFVRTRETAEIVADKIGIAKESIIFDERLREGNFGIFEGKNPVEYHAYFSETIEKFNKELPEGETLTDMKKRITELLYETDENRKNKNILFVSHEYPVWMMFAGAYGWTNEMSIKEKEGKPDFLNHAEILELNFAPIPHNKDYVLDLHRPYIDEVEFECKCGSKMERIPDVFDCWVESGAMPYGQAHYPFENKEEFEKNFPAEFIAEGLDQTRGWFYTLLVLSTALFDKPAFKNVIVNGIILAEDGQKMAKRLNNYPDPAHVIEKYGADALRLYLLSSPAVRAESLNFAEDGVDEVRKKVILRLLNVLSFYEIYANESPDVGSQPSDSENVLDRWIVTRLNELIVEVTESLDKYELDRAVRPIGDFVDDLSTWYLRRSRDRFKSDGDDKNNASATMKFVLLELAKIIAPFMPFTAEKIYKSLETQNSKLKTQNHNSKLKSQKSVHLEAWSEAGKIDKNIIEKMETVRNIASLGLDARTKEGIKVRQPLNELRIKNYELGKEFEDIIKDELNVKKITSKGGEGELSVELDTTITDELKEEGLMRDLVRTVQGMRKKEGLIPQDKINIVIFVSDNLQEIIKKYKDSFEKDISAKSLEFKPLSEKSEAKIKINDEELAVEIGI